MTLPGIGRVLFRIEVWLVPLVPLVAGGLGGRGLGPARRAATRRRPDTDARTHTSHYTTTDTVTQDTYKATWTTNIQPLPNGKGIMYNVTFIKHGGQTEKVENINFLSFTKNLLVMFCYEKELTIIKNN